MYSLFLFYFAVKLFLVLLNTIIKYCITMNKVSDPEEFLMSSSNVSINQN